VSVRITGTATNGVDYSTRSATITIPAGSATQTVLISPIDDLVVEGFTSETVVYTLLTNAAYLIGPTITTHVFIVDNEPMVSITATDATASENPGNSGLFTVSRTGVVTAPLAVGLNISGTAINGGDYTTIPSSVTIPAGSASQTIAVNPINDTMPEGANAETVVLNIKVGAAYGIGTGQATVSIADDEPIVSVFATDATSTETAGNTGLFTITRTGSTALALNVTLRIEGTATNGTDYVTIPTTVTIPVGSATRGVVVTPIDDVIAEGITDEYVLVTIANGPGYSVSGFSQAVYIKDN
jgi:hypothetical protein